MLFSEIAGPIKDATNLPSGTPERKQDVKEKNSTGAFWTAVIVTLLVHLVAAVVIYFFVPQKNVHQSRHPLEAVLLMPPPQIPAPKPPPSPPRPRVVRVEKPEPKIPPPPIQPVVTPSPEPEVKNEEPPLPVAPVDEPPLPPSPSVPVEAPVVLPEYNAAYLRNLPPPYPSIARRMKIEGSVRLRAFVNTGGLPVNIEIVKSSGSSILDDAAVKAVKGWSFVPAKKGTEAVEAWVEIPINFSLINK